MKRKAVDINDEESQVSQLLFNKSQKFIENIVPKKQDELAIELKPAWADDDDNNFAANIIPNVKSTNLYTEQLKQKYETLMGTPNWAKLKPKNESETEEDDEILRTVGHLHKKRDGGLHKDNLEIKRLPPINPSSGKKFIITCVEFHPKISATLMAGNLGVVSLFSIGGEENNKLHSFKLKSWKISNACFTPDGTEAYIASKNNHKYCIYDLVKAEHREVSLPKTVRLPTIFQLSSDGKYIAASDGYEEVSLISSASKEMLRILKHNSCIQSVTFSYDCSQLICYGKEGEITIWDLSTYRPVKKFYDHGCVNASSITTSPCGKLLATGSAEGIVNIYETTNLTTTTPVPLKVISHLTTKITSLKFNASSEILATASSYFPNAIKLIHIPSYHVFANFPKLTDKLHQVDALNFSPNSGYMALTNNKGFAKLYRLKHFKNY